jgi:flavin-dependent dehydrogenase
MKNEEKFAGFADFFPASTAIKEGKLYVGEAAGFLDNLTGFGMFYAIRSGYFAAKSITESADYDKLWKTEFNDSIRSSMTSRFALEIAGNLGYGLMPGFIEKNQENLLDLLKNSYKFDWKMKLIYPLALMSMRGRVRRE